MQREKFDPLEEAKQLFKTIDFRALQPKYAPDRQSYELERGRIKGKVLYDVNDYEVIEVVYKQGARVRPHFHDVLETHHVITGELVLNSKEGKVYIHPQESYTVAAEQEHSVMAVIDTVALIIRKPTSGEHRTDARRSETPH